MKISFALVSSSIILATSFAFAQDVNTLLLKNYRPKSVYVIPESHITHAKYPVIDMHTHPYPTTTEELKQWVSTMDTEHIQKALILTYSTGSRFDSLYKVYAAYGNRFEVWCGFDYTGMDEPGWSQKAVKELERCFQEGARGVGELGDKGLGELYSRPTKGYGMHLDDPRLKPLLAKCGELKMPVSVHVSDPHWMYLPMDSTNDGLMNAYTWRIDTTKEGLLNHRELLQTLENAVRDNPHTIFIACHLANCSYNLALLGNLLDKYPNLYADIAARYAETAAIPRAAAAFITHYQDRIVYGTDMGTQSSMYNLTFRILETTDEHFYDHQHSSYHWPLYGLGLSDEVLQKVYRDNAMRILSR